MTDTATGSSSLAGQARRAADRAAEVAGVRIEGEHTQEQLHDVADLLAAIWETPAHTSPIGADLLQSFAHAGCNISVAYTQAGVMCGAAVAIVEPLTQHVYSLIAGVLPNTADHGVGFALKQHQRAWSLERGLTTMKWTFDPLVSRNARFNLTKLGARANEYSRNFYGLMADRLNAGDESDRLTAVWSLTSPIAVACSEGQPPPVIMPKFTPAQVLGNGPDGEPSWVETDDVQWCRVPADIVALRAEHGNDGLPTRWRMQTRDILTRAFEAGRTATGVSQSGWYRLSLDDLNDKQPAAATEDHAAPTDAATTAPPTEAQH